MLNTKTAKFAYLTAFPFPDPARVHVLHSLYDLKAITVIGHYPNESMFALINAIDILIAILPKTNQRMPLKYSDYLNATSSVIFIEQVFHKELRSLMKQSDMWWVYSSSDTDKAAA